MAVQILKNTVSPNLLLSTTYAINKSNSKRVIVGLEYNGGFCKPVIKLCGSGVPSKYVTLDAKSWETLNTHMDTMTAYFQHAYSFYQDFGNPTKILLPQHDIHFTTAYGSRSIAIDERPLEMITNLFHEENIHEKEEEELHGKERYHSTVQSSGCKKRKVENPPGIVMQQASFDGLKELRECINERIIQLEEYSVLTKHCLNFILDFIKNALLAQEGTAEEVEERIKNTLKDKASFKQYYTMKRNEIEEVVKNKLQSENYDEKIVKMILLEIYSFVFPVLAQDLYNAILTNWRHVPF